MNMDRVQEINLENKLGTIVRSLKKSFKNIDDALEDNIDKQFKPYYDNIASLNNYLITKYLEDIQ